MPVRKISKKSGGSPNEVTVTFKFLSGKKHEVKVKNGATYGDALNLFLGTYDGPDYGISDGVFILNKKAINTEEQLEEKITDNINISITRFNVGGALEFTIALENYNDENPARLKETINKIKENKIATLKKELPATLKLLDNPVNSINLKTARPIKSGTSSKSSSAESDKDYIEDEDLIVLIQTNNGKKFVSAHDKKALSKWLRMKNTLPDNRQRLTSAEIKKIEESVGYGEKITVGASTSRAEIMNNFMNIPAVRAPRPVINRSRSASPDTIRANNNMYDAFYRAEISTGVSPDTARERASTRTVNMINLMDTSANRAPRPVINNEELPRGRISPPNDIYGQMYRQQIDTGFVDPALRARARELNARTNSSARSSISGSPNSSNRSRSRRDITRTNPASPASTFRRSVSGTSTGIREPSSRSSASRRSSARTLPSGSESRSYDRSSAPSLPPGSPLSSRASTNNPDGSPRPNSRRSSATPRASPRSMARAAAIARANPRA